MAETLTPFTELEAVNDIISMLGESPVATLEENQVIEASLALRFLRNENRRFQTRGWMFNTEPGMTLNPTSSGYIELPRNTLKADTVGGSAGTDVVIRGNRLYDRGNHTYQFEDPVEVDLIIGLTFEELPSSARNYVTVKAARTFQDRYAGDEALHAYTRDDERYALMVVLEEEMEQADPNMLTDSNSIRSITARGY